ncbi:uncharacterized protein LOC108739172 [Agrilus planipennis]|uniref:Uncharacterized protein LOC108739172 n=1 Tax=Agrilus planipennis TaxID=224129 RepID=A0A1W4X6I6_AGRPL|nr:uncharacterized protein LOC108739172 [Agrilus planipennis]
MPKIVTVGFLLVFCAVFFDSVQGHGLLIDPPNRSSLWRFFSYLPVNYNDNQNFCGGFGVQWYQNEGKCGVCGDNYADPQPRNNENTGTYGNGVVTAQYLAGSILNVTVLLTANHLGYFTYSICALKDPNAHEPEECFVDLPLIDGTYKHSVDSEVNIYVNQIQLPANLTCDRCVLRWHYNTGNSWGFCNNGTSGIGCGPQEVFRSCSDISVIESDENYDGKVVENFNVISSKLNAVANSLR